MRIWASRDVPVAGVDLVAGWQDIDEADWDRIKGGNRVANLSRDGVLKWKDTAPEATPPTKREPVELPAKASDVVKLIKAAGSVTHLQSLGVADDERPSVAKAYSAKLKELDG